MRVEELLLACLDDLYKDDFKTFKWRLSINALPGCKPIAKSHLEEAERIDTVTKMIECYGEDMAVSVTVEILKKMNNNNAAEKLKKDYEGGKTAAAAASSSVLAAPAPPPTSLLAQQGSVVIAPMITGSTTGSCNITINNR